MLRTILVPLDGSRLSEKAIPYATTLAQAAGAELVFMRSVGGSFHDGLKKEARDYLDSKVADARKMGLHVEAQVSEDEAGPSIQQFAEDIRPDIIVMSTHGRSALGRVVWGSVADYVLHHVTVPTFLVGKNVETGWTAGRRPVFLVPLDGSSLSAEALPLAEELAVAFHGEITLVEAIDSDTWLLSAVDPWDGYALAEPVMTGLGSAQAEAARQHLGTLATRLSARGIPTTFTVQEGNAASVIRQAVRDYQATAVVMATHGRDGATRLLLGSVTDAIVRSARLPVVVVRPQGILPPTAAGRNEPGHPEQNVLFPMTISEVELTRVALDRLLNGGGHQIDDTAPVQELLQRLNRIQGSENPTIKHVAAGSSR